MAPWCRWKPHCSFWVSSFTNIWNLQNPVNITMGAEQWNPDRGHFLVIIFSRLWPCLTLILVLQMQLKNPVIHNSPTSSRTLKCLKLVPWLWEAFERHIGDLCQGNRFVVWVFKLSLFSCGHSSWMKEYLKVHHWNQAQPGTNPDFNLVSQC